MVFANDFLDMMQDTCTFATIVSRDEYGVPTFSAPTTFNCRVFRKNHLVTDKNGQRIVSTAQAWICGAIPATPESQFTLSDGSKPVVLSVDAPDDETGSDALTKVYFR